MKLKIEYIPTSEIRTYANNAKIHTAEQIEQIKESIKEFGFNDPIALWENNEIIEGHGRLISAIELGIDKVPVIRLNELTDEQRKAYMLVHNKLTMNTDFDFDILEQELEDLSNIDMEKFGFDLDFDDEAEYEPHQWDAPIDDDEDDRAPSMQHNVFENQDRMQFPILNKYGFPVMEQTQTVGDKFIRFCDWKWTEGNPSEYIAHFFYDDFKFISAWREPDKYVERLRNFKAVISPDFSLYTDFPMALQILSCYRRQWCGAYWQALGIDVIPDVIWGEPDTFEWCFDGIPEGGTVAVSSVGVKRDKDWNGKGLNLFKLGFDEMIKRLHPTTILYYGDMIDGLEGNIIRIPSFYEQKREKLNEMSRLKNISIASNNEQEEI